MVYNSKDAIQAAIGALTAVVFILVIRSGQPIFIDPTIGLILGIGWLILLFNTGVSNREGRLHFISNLAISLAVTTALSFAFKVVESGPLSFDFFGSAPWIIGVLVAFPVAQIFDKNNIRNPEKRFFIRK